MTMVTMMTATVMRMMLTTTTTAFTTTTTTNHHHCNYYDYQYHSHIGRPATVLNAFTGARSKWYGPRQIDEALHEFENVGDGFGGLARRREDNRNDVHDRVLAKSTRTTTSADYELLISTTTNTITSNY